MAVDLAHHGEQGRDLREQASGQGQGADAPQEGLGTSGRDAVAVLAEQGPDERDVAGAGADQGVTDQQAAADVALGVREPVSGAVSAEQAGFSEGPSVPAVGFYLPRPCGVHRGEVGVGHDDLVAEGFEAAGDLRGPARPDPAAPGA